MQKPYYNNDVPDKREEKDKNLLHENPLLWAMTQLSKWNLVDSIRDRNVTFAEVVQVATQALTNRADDLNKFSNSGVIELIADLATISCMLTTLQVQWPPFKKLSFARKGKGSGDQLSIAKGWAVKY